VIHDEIGGHPVASKISGSLRMVHSDREILVNLEMEVRGVHSMVVADRADLLTPSYLLPFVNHDPVEMTVE